MNTVFLNGNFMPLEDAKISPLDRGFLFGEGIYEVIPCYQNKLVAWEWHMERLQAGLRELNIGLHFSIDDLKQWCQQLTQYNPEPDQGIYIHITRGAETRRFHGWSNTSEATVFMMAYPIPAITEPTRENTKTLTVKVEQDKRWRHCHIKSTSLLGNVMHFQDAMEEGKNEVLLLSADGKVSEASTSNVFILSNDVVKTPPLSADLLPGITRRIILAILREYSDFKVKEQHFEIDELMAADEVWLTSSTKGVVPVVKVGDALIADGLAGAAWLKTAQLYFQHRFD